MALSLAELEKDYKKWEAGKAKQAEMANKSNQPAPTFRKVPTLDELSRKQANDRVAETSKQAEKNMRAKERNNVSGVMGDNNASRYNSRFSLDKEVLKDAGRNLSQMAINNAMAQEEEARYNAERIEESRARREASRKRIEDEVKAIQNKGDLASQEEFDRYDELLNTAQGRGFIEHDSPYLVSREKYNQLAKTTNLENDLEPLAMAYSTEQGTRGRGTRAIQNMGYNSVDDYVDQLSKRYELTPDEVKDVVKTFQSNRTRGQERQAAIKMYEYGQKHPVLGGTLSALASPASGVEGYYNTAANILTGDNRNQSNLLSNITEYSKRGGAESFDSKAGQNAYNFIVGGAGMALNAKGGLPAIAAMGGNTANDAMNMAIERGVAPEQAAAYGLAAGGADTLFNAMGFNAIDDALKKETVKSVGDVLRNLGVGALTEAGENVAQDITQTIADEIINGQNSEIRQTYEDYVYSGMSAEDAFKQTAVDYAEQLGGSAATGAIGGAIFSGMGMAGENAVLPTLNKAAGKVNDWKTARDSKNAQDLRSRLLADEVPNLDENYRNQIEDLVANNTDEARPVPTIGDIDVDNIDWGRGEATEAESAPVEVDPNNVVYHSGTLSRLNKSETRGKMSEGTRDTGYFGTGHYFVDGAHKGELDNNSQYSAKPYSSVDISQYNNLYKADTDAKASALHDFSQRFMRYVNGHNNKYFTDSEGRINVEERAEYIDNLYSRFRELFPEQNISREGFEAELENYKNNHRDVRLEDRGDSEFTQFMKSMGYNGVDTRGTRSANTERGVVIYDLDENSILQSNVNDAEAKNGLMNTRVRNEGQDVFDTNEDARIGKIIEGQEKEKAIQEEYHRIYDDTELRSTEDNIAKINKQLQTLEQDTKPYYEALLRNEDALNREVNQRVREFGELGLEVDANEERASILASAEQGIAEADARIAELNQELAGAQELLTAEQFKANDAYNRARATINEVEYINEEKGIYKIPDNIKEIAESNRAQVKNMESVASVKKGMFRDGDKNLKDKVFNYFKKWNNKAHNEVLGDVTLTRKNIKDSIYHNKLTRRKVDTFAVVPDVIEKGKIIDYQPSWKDRDYDTAIIVAPTTIENENGVGEEYITGVIVRRNKGMQKFYMHDAVSLKKGEPSLEAQETSSDIPSGSEGTTLFYNILRDIADDKYNYENNVQSQTPTVYNNVPRVGETPSLLAENNQPNKVMAEDIGAMPRANAKEKAESIESEPVNRESFNREGEAKFMTNTAPGAGIYGKVEYENSPVLQEMAKIAKTSNEESYSNAMDIVNTRGQEWYDDVVNGKYQLGQDANKANTDFDTGMIILQGLADQLEFAKTDAERQAIVAQRNALLRKMKDFSHNVAIGLQAHAKWSNTADGAIMAGERLIGAREKVWAGQNKSKVEGNKTIAQALAKINDGTIEKPEKIPLTHEQIRDGIKAEIEKEFGSVSDRFTDTAFEYLTSLVENHVSTDIIADEIVHYLNHGEFFTIDESLPMKKKMSSTLVSVLKNMGNDSLKEKNKPLDNGYPKKSHATIVEEVRNTLETEYAGLGLDSDTDVEFIATMIEEGVPKWKIEDEINHRLDTGEWYTLDESTRVSREKSSKLVRAFKEQGDKTPKKEKQEIGFAKRKERIINTLEDEFGSIDGLFTDEAINKLVDLEEKLSASQLIDQIEHYLQHGEFYELTEDAPKNLPKMGALSNMLDRISGVETPKAEKTPDTYEQIREKVENTFADDSSSFEGNFNDNDYDFLATMFYEKVPKWLIEDELRYRMEHGEWYTIDESIDSAKPKNQRFKNALNSLVGEPTQKVEKPAPTLDELREQIRNTLEEEPSSTIDVTDENIDYLAGLMSQGATTAEIADALNTYMATGSFGISAETQAEVNSYFKAMDRVNPESKEYAQLQAEAFRLIANEVNGKASALEKFDAWRYLAMLGNPKTMLRNLVGNTMFNAVTGISNTVAALGEEAADRRSIKKTGHGIENRTRAVINPFDRGAIKTAKNDFDLMRYVSGAGTKYKDTKNALRDASSVFDSKAIQLYEKFVNAGISDTFAVRNKYATSLLGYMKANGLTQADMDASYKFDELNRLSRRKLLTEGERAEMESLREIHQKMEDARDFALKEAEYATFHEDNKFADTLSKWSNDSAVAKVFIDGMMPFKKTPANVLRSGLEYSPLGIAKSGYLTIKRAKEMKGDYADTYEKTGLFDRSKTKEVKRTYANDVIDSWSKSLTGTVLAGLGYLLYSKGVLQSGTEDEKYQDDLEGLQNFSIKLNGHTYTIDWAAPAVMPLLLGAEVKKVMDENAISGKDVDADEVIRIINSTLNPIMETSMLQGVQNTLETVSRQASNSNGAEFAGGVLGSLATNLATGYVTQAIPTLSGQLARTLDGTRRATDTVSTTAAGSEAEKQLRKTANKIPFLSRINNPYVNARGETQSNNPLEYSEKFTDEPLKNIGKGLVNFAYQSVSPGYLQKIDTRPSDEIARRAYNGLDENGKPIKDADVFANWKSQVKINGQKLDPDQMYNYRVASGQANTEIREQLAQADWFNHLSADRQTEILKNTNSLVDHIGKAAADPAYTTENSAFEAYQEKGIDGVVEYYYESAHNKDIKNALGSSADFQKQLYDSGDEARMAKYREGLGVAQQIMPDKKSLSEEQFLKYEKYGADALKKELSYAKKADDLGVSNNKTFQTLVNKGISDESIKKAYDAITAIKTGEDEYGRDEFMPFNEDSYNLYQKYGSTGLKEYQEMKKQNVSYETWQQAHKAIPTLTKSSYINMFKAMDGKTGSKPDGDISQKELLYLFNKNNYSDAQAKAYWNAFGKISGDNAWKSVPVLKYNKKTGKNEWTTESKKKAK